MKKQSGYFLLLLSVAAIFNSCKNSSDYQKTKSGILYKIFSDGKDSAAKAGQFLKFNYQAKIGSSDSVLATTYGKAPGYAKVETTPDDAYSPTEVFNKVRAGDSIIVVQFIDSIIKRSQGAQLPPFLKKGDKIIMTFKIMNVFKTEGEATADRSKVMELEKARLEKENEGELVNETKDMEAWLAKNNITAQKTGTGTYVAVKDPGTGMQADSGKYVSVRYTGKTLEGAKEFESNMDPKKEAYTFMLGVGGVIPGWDQGLKLFKKGGKGTLYIPGALSYGKNPPQGSPFKAYEALVFDVEMVNVSDTAPTPTHQQMTPQMRAEMQRQMQQQMQQQRH
jgi:FKBP-type peptidyl-prolyl cis-trans isomerase